MTPHPVRLFLSSAAALVSVVLCPSRCGERAITGPADNRTKYSVVPRGFNGLWYSTPPVSEISSQVLFVNVQLGKRIASCVGGVGEGLVE